MYFPCWCNVYEIPAKTNVAAIYTEIKEKRKCTDDLDVKDGGTSTFGLNGSIH